MASHSTTLNSRFRVNSNGFALFIIGLTIAGFVGGAVRFFLNSQQAQDRILSELKTRLPEWKVEADRVQLLLASGIWPGLTMVLPQARLERLREDPCESITIQVRDLRLPMSMWSMIQGQHRLGNASAQELDVELSQADCPKAERKIEVLGSSENNSRSKDLGFKHIFDSIRNRIDGLHVQKLTVSDSRVGSWSLSAQPLTIDVGSRIRAWGQISVWKRFESGEIRQNLSISANLQSSLLDWNIKSSIKEGEANWYGQIDELGRTFLQRFEMRQGPVTDLVDLLRVSGFIEKSFVSKRAWVNCRVSQGGSFKELKDIETLPIRIESCGLEGEGGKVRVSPVTVYVKPPYLRNGPLEVSVNQFPLQSVVDFLGTRVADRVIHDMGRWSGSGHIYAPEKWSVQGEIEDVKVSISNQSLRGTETISSLRLRAEKTWDQLKITFFDFKIPGGSRGGEVGVVLDSKTQNGILTAKFAGLSLSSTVQELLFRGRGEAIALSGQGSFIDGKLNDFHGEFRWPSVRGKGWIADDIHGEFRLKNQELDSKIFIKNFGWSREYFYSKFLEQLKQKLSLEEGFQKLTDISMDLSIDSKGGAVKKTLGHADRKTLSFSGGWARSAALTGKVFVSTPGSPSSKAIVEITNKSAQILK